MAGDAAEDVDALTHDIAQHEETFRIESPLSLGDVIDARADDAAQKAVFSADATSLSPAPSLERPRLARMAIARTSPATAPDPQSSLNGNIAPM